MSLFVETLLFIALFSLCARCDIEYPQTAASAISQDDQLDGNIYRELKCYENLYILTFLISFKRCSFATVNDWHDLNLCKSNPENVWQFISSTFDLDQDQAISSNELHNAFLNQIK